MKTEDAIALVIMFVILVVIDTRITEKFNRLENHMVVQQLEITDLVDENQLQEKMIKKLAKEIRR